MIDEMDRAIITDRENRISQLQHENEQLRTALRDLVHRLSTNRALHSAIDRACYVLEKKP
jgi:hypothetical protein